MDKDKLYRVAFFLAYHKEARPGRFWRFYGLTLDSRLREVLSRITADYYDLSRTRQILFDDYLDLLLKQEHEKLGQDLDPGEADRAAVKAMEASLGLNTMQLAATGKKRLEVSITAEEDQFENAVAAGLATVFQHLSEGKTELDGETEYGSYQFTVYGKKEH